jgi:hypothetical protein
MKKQKKLVLTGIVIFSVIMVLIVLLPNTLIAISRGYVTEDSGLKPGMAARLSTDSKENNRIERASFDAPDKFIGIATKFEDSSVTLASAEETILVEKEGEITAYVSDLDGRIKKGDSLTLSPISGILAKAANDSSLIVGIALDDFTERGAENFEIDSAEGKRTVRVNKLKMILYATSTLASSKPDSSLERLGQSVVGKEVSEIRMIIALLIFFIVIIAEGSIIYGAVSSAVTSLGRNPLARSSIKRELLRISLVAIAVLSIGLGAVYLILWA